MCMVAGAMVTEVITHMVTIPLAEVIWEDHNLRVTLREIMHTDISLMLHGVLVAMVLEKVTEALEVVKASSWYLNTTVE